MITDLLEGSVYVIHAKKGYEVHEKRIRSLFAKHQLEFEFMTDGDPSLFTNALLHRYFPENITSKMGKGIISCTLNHLLSYEKIVQRGDQYGLIFENDPVFLGNFTQKLNRLIPELDKLEPGFIVSLENTTLKFPSMWQTQTGKYLYPAKVSRMAGAYLIDQKGAQQALEYVKENKCTTAIDWVQNELIGQNVIQMYWAHPPLVEQGSHNGLMAGTISTKPKSMKQRVKWLFNKYYKMYFRRLFPQRRVIKE